eukprot:3490615-Amphidinium_carterae.1
MKNFLPSVAHSLWHEIFFASREQVVEVLSSPQTKVVTLTVTEKGYCSNLSTGALDMSLEVVQQACCMSPVASAIPLSIFDLCTKSTQVYIQIDAHTHTNAQRHRVDENNSVRVQ